MAMGSHRGVRQGREWVRFSWKCLWGQSRGGQRQDWSQELVGQQWCEAGKDHPGAGVALTPRKEALGTIFTVCKCLNLHGEDSLGEPTCLSVLENGCGVQGSLRRAGISLIPGQAGFSSSPGQASSYLDLSSDGLAVMSSPSKGACQPL